MTAKMTLVVVAIIFSLLSASVQAKFSRDFHNVCTSEGLMCKNCSVSSYCTPMPNGMYLETEMAQCAVGTSCHQNTGVCSSNFNTDCSINSFKCIQLGSFPDPFDCTKYHTCVYSPISESMEDYYGTCPNGYAYNTMNGLCNIKITGSGCAGTVPVCTAVGERGPVAGNPSLYYQCRLSADGVTLYPDIFVCPNNFEFDGNACVDPTPPSGIGTNGLCVQEGDFYYPDDCQKHIECAGAGRVPSVRTCSSSYRFDYKLGKCVHFTCQNQCSKY